VSSFQHLHGLLSKACPNNVTASKGEIEQQVLLLMISWGSKPCDLCSSVLKSSLAHGDSVKMLLHLEKSVICEME